MSSRDDFGSTAGRPGGYSSGAGGSSNGGVAGGRGGGNTGITTGNTWYGNTAFGRPGGMALGYAMRDPRSLAAAGMRPSIGLYSQFMDTLGNPMFSGALGGSSFYGRNAPQALSQAQRAMNMLHINVPQPASAPITQQPLPPLQPPVQPPVRTPLNKETMPVFFGGSPNPTWGPITDVFTQPLQRDLANRNWTGNPVNIKGVIGGQGVPGYSSGGSGYRSYTGAGRKSDRGGNAGY